MSAVETAITIEGRRQHNVSGPFFCQSPGRFVRGYVLFIASVAVPQGDSSAARYRERVTVTGPTRLDWTFAVVKQSRTNPPPEWIGRDYDSTQQTYELFAPQTNALGDKHPLVLFISHTDQANGWRSWSEVCRRNNIIFAGPHGAGRRQNVARRIRVVLDVLDDVRQRYSVDSDRTYLCGFSTALTLHVKLPIC